MHLRARLEAVPFQNCEFLRKLIQSRARIWIWISRILLRELSDRDRVTAAPKMETRRYFGVGPLTNCVAVGPEAKHASCYGVNLACLHLGFCWVFRKL